MVFLRNFKSLIREIRVLRVQKNKFCATFALMKNYKVRSLEAKKKDVKNFYFKNNS